MSSTESALPPSAQLQFYLRPEALTAERHGGLWLKKTGGYQFARQTNSVAITGTEFSQAMRFYPVVFSGKKPYPVLVLGLKDENQFVDGNGHWRAGHYIPAYMRRYPFAFIAHPDGKQFILGIDRSCERLVAGEAENASPLFEDGKPGAVTEEALKFCAAYQADHGYTVAYGQALEEQALLIDHQAQAKLADGKVINLAGFRVVDRKKFAALPDSVVADWHKKGWLALVYYHLASLERFAGLLEPAGRALPQDEG